MSNTDITVLVTGVSGYLAGHCMLYLLEAGYTVRGTVRSQEGARRAQQIAVENTSRAENLQIVEADLLQDEGWDAAVQGCEYVLHIASPFPDTAPKDEKELVHPAVDGTRRVLAAAARAGVKRVVLTSSIAAVSSAHPDPKRTFTEDDWSQLNGAISAYPKSKTLAEQAAWDFVKNLPEGQNLELAVINPGYILGPVLDGRPCTSTLLLSTLLSGGLPGITRLHFNIVDVRDVAAAHLAAMTNPEANGKRFVCVAGGIWLPEIANTLADAFRPRGYRVPTLVLPNFIVRLYGLFDRTVRDNTREIGIDTQFDTSRIREILGWQACPMEATIVEMAETMIEKEMV